MTDPRVGILDLEMGNLRSVSNAIDSLGYDISLVAGGTELDDLTHLVIPGVGSFHTAMQRMRRKELVEGVRQFVGSGRPVLGLCLGMQLLGSAGDEGEVTPGLDVIPGTVTRLDDDLVPAIPHVGWNSVEFTGAHPLLEKVRNGVDFYFVHSYHFSAVQDDSVIGTTDCGQRIASVIGRGCAVGLQFHPEKSQGNGLRLLDNFCRWDGQC